MKKIDITATTTTTKNTAGRKKAAVAAILLTGACLIAGCGSTSAKKSEQESIWKPITNSTESAADDSATSTTKNETKKETAADQNKADASSTQEQTQVGAGDGAAEVTKETLGDVTFFNDEEGENGYLQAYAMTLGTYYTALKEGWSEEKLLEKGLSPLIAEQYGATALDDVGYALIYNESDDTDPALYIGAMDHQEYPGNVVYAVYILENGTEKSLAVSDARCRYYLQALTDDGSSYTLCREGSNSAFQQDYETLLIDDDVLHVSQAIRHDTQAASEWQMGWEENGAVTYTDTDEEMANALISSWQGAFFTPAYRPFSE